MQTFTTYRDAFYFAMSESGRTGQTLSVAEWSSGFDVAESRNAESRGETVVEIRPDGLVLPFNPVVKLT